MMYRCTRLPRWSLQYFFVSTLFAIVLAQANSSFAEDRVLRITHNYKPELDGSTGQDDYERHLLKQILERTSAEFGPYELLSLPSVVNNRRAIELMRIQRYPNHIRTLGYRSKLTTEKNLNYVAIPVYLGMVGFRTCFASPQTAQRLQSIDSLEELRDFSFGLGNGWSDVEVLQHNGFKVQEVSNHGRLFEMVALNRVDLYCRGSNELLQEYGNVNTVDNLVYDRSILIFYPMPLFFYTHKDNVELLNRLNEGMRQMKEDGSHIALWEQYFKDSVDFVGLDTRKKYRLENPALADLPIEIEREFYINR